MLNIFLLYWNYWGWEKMTATWPEISHILLAERKISHFWAASVKSNIRGLQMHNFVASPQPYCTDEKTEAAWVQLTCLNDCNVAEKVFIQSLPTKKLRLFSSISQCLWHEWFTGMISLEFIYLHPYADILYISIIRNAVSCYFSSWRTGILILNQSDSFLTWVLLS